MLNIANLINRMCIYSKGRSYGATLMRFQRVFKESLRNKDMESFITHLLQKNILLARFLWHCMYIRSNSVMQIMYEGIIKCPLLWTRFGTPSTIASDKSTIQRIIQAWSRDPFEMDPGDVENHPACGYTDTFRNPGLRYLPDGRGEE